MHVSVWPSSAPLSHHWQRCTSIFNAWLLVFDQPNAACMSIVVPSQPPSHTMTRTSSSTALQVEQLLKVGCSSGTKPWQLAQEFTVRQLHPHRLSICPLAEQPRHGMLLLCIAWMQSTEASLQRKQQMTQSLQPYWPRMPLLCRRQNSNSSSWQKARLRKQAQALSQQSLTTEQSRTTLRCTLRLLELQQQQKQQRRAR